MGMGIGAMTKVGGAPWHVMEGQLDNSQEEEEQHLGNGKAISRAAVLEPVMGGWAGFSARLVENRPGKSWSLVKPCLLHLCDHRSQASNLMGGLIKQVSASSGFDSSLKTLQS